MLEIAMNNKKVQNLEANKKEIKGTIVKTSFEHFTDPEFIAIASKIGVEIDDGLTLSARHVENQLETQKNLSNICRT